MKAALGIMTTDTQPKMSMKECTIGNTPVKDLWHCERLRNDIS